MLHNHESHCKHGNLAYCDVCKVVYCKDCRKEWRDVVYKWYWTYPYVYTSPNWNLSDTVPDNYTFTVNSCSHLTS